MDFLADYSLQTLLFLAIFAFIAGFLDAIVGGGGLIQLPALLIQLPKLPLPILFGTNKIAALSGTSIAAAQYARKIKFNPKILLTILFFSGLFSFFRSKNNKLHPALCTEAIGINHFNLHCHLHLS